MTERFRRLSTPRTAMIAAVACLVLTTCSPAVSTLTVDGVAARGAGGPLRSQSVPVTADPDAPGAVPASRTVDPPDLPTQGAGQGETAPVSGGDAAAAGDFEEVAVQTPTLRLDGVPLERETILQEVLGIEGVAFATALTIGQVDIASKDVVTAVRVAAVDPAGFRVLTPQVTADAVEVWQRISEGDAAFLHDVGHRLELELGQRLPAANRTTLRVGALASNGAPPVADAIVSSDTGEELGLEGTRSVLISVAGDSSAGDVAERVEQAIGMVPEVLEQPTEQRAFLSGAAARNAFEPFNYVSFGDGMIQIDSAWVRRNIVRAEVPILRGAVVCHRLLIPQLRGALQEIKDRGLADLIDPTQYGGCWVPRHILFNADRGLSMHAWGLAADFNVSTNGYGATPQMDPRIVEIFDRWGFVWGGRWGTPDGMHFELGAILQ
ncbi:MAG: M15 family metallopeptidase [Egibacteraceae bacterium]